MCGFFKFHDHPCHVAPAFATFCCIRDANCGSDALFSSRIRENVANRLLLAGHPAPAVCHLYDRGITMVPIASFCLARLPARRGVTTVTRLAVDRHSLAANPGLVLGRELLTDTGCSTSLTPDLARWALFTVWEDEAALDDWQRTSPLLARWRRTATELWCVRLECLTAHGTWGEVEPFPGMAGAAHAAGAGPVAVLTRSRVKARRLGRFYRSTDAVASAVTGADGRMASVGFQEWPFGKQGTFSLWRSTDDLTAFAYGHSRHREVVRRTRSEGWYGEELFARFRPYRASGTWGGRQPLG